jgi:hypothetical protein
VANEDEANEARQRHGKSLLQQGVHAIGVEDGKAHGKRGWVVVAHVSPDKPMKLPASLDYQTAHGQGEVPLVVKYAEPFKPE